MPHRLLTVLVALALVAGACGGAGVDGSGPAGAGDATTTSTPAPTGPAVGPPTSRGLPDPVAVDPLTADPGSTVVLSAEPPYAGVLGQTDPERIVAEPVALPPAPAADGIAPLTGIPLTDPGAARRPAIVVKIDNTARGRPQASLSRADLVYEEMIEGGFTRLAAVFHSDAPLLGPVRSGRTTDIGILGSLGRPIFAWSGANKVHAALLREQDIVDLGAQTRNEYVRAGDRPSTYDLVVEAADLFEVAAARGETGTPPPHFEYRDDTVGLPATARPADRVAAAYPSVLAEWSWNGEGWERTQDGTPHVDADGNRIVAANVIVAEVDDVPTGSVDTAGATVREQVFLGSGDGWVFTDGHVVEATWTKPSIRSVATWTTPDGVPVALTPGTTWIELVQPGTVEFT